MSEFLLEEECDRIVVGWRREYQQVWRDQTQFRSDETKRSDRSSDLHLGLGQGGVEGPSESQRLEK